MILSITTSEFIAYGPDIVVSSYNQRPPTVLVGIVVIDKLFRCFVNVRPCHHRGHLIS